MKPKPLREVNFSKISSFWATLALPIEDNGVEPNQLKWTALHLVLHNHPVQPNTNR